MKGITELWAPVLINGGIFKDTYLVSNLGRVKQKRTYKNGNYQFVLLKIINGKRPSVKISGGGRTYSKSVAKLVLSSFQYRKGCECANITYLDGNMKNCALSNLMYTADKTVYNTAELDKKKCRSKSSHVSIPAKQPVLKSCKTCSKCPCFDGMSNLSTDFGAVGCKKYSPK